MENLISHNWVSQTKLKCANASVALAGRNLCLTTNKCAENWLHKNSLSRTKFQHVLHVQFCWLQHIAWLSSLDMIFLLKSSLLHQCCQLFSSSKHAARSTWERESSERENFMSERELAQGSSNFDRKISRVWFQSASCRRSVETWKKSSLAPCSLGRREKGLILCYVSGEHTVLKWSELCNFHLCETHSRKQRWISGLWSELVQCVIKFGVVTSARDSIININSKRISG